MLPPFFMVYSFLSFLLLAKYLPFLFQYSKMKICIIKNKNKMQIWIFFDEVLEGCELESKLISHLSFVVINTMSNV